MAVYTIKKQRRNKWCLRYHLFDVKNDAEAAKNLARHILRALSGICLFFSFLIRKNLCFFYEVIQELFEVKFYVYFQVFKDRNLY